MALAFNTLIFIFLTLLTQIGGFAFLISLGAARLLKLSQRLVRLLLFLGLYGLVTIATHVTAPLFGRVPLSCFGGEANVKIQPVFCLLNRNYVTPPTQRVAVALADHMATSFPGTVTVALDANFPFLDGFPLPPHLSHDDGRKLDIAFYYRDSSGEAVNGRTRSPVGYFAFEQPQAGAALPCAGGHDTLTFRWDLEILQPLFPNWTLDEQRTAAAVRWLSSQGRGLGVEKIFIEPHLAKRLAVTNDSVRFQGCRAARHEDHIHFQVSQ